MGRAEQVAKQSSLMGCSKAGKFEGNDRAKKATKGNITHFLVQKERIYLNQQKGRLMKGPLPAPVHMIFGLTDTAIASTFSFKSGESNQPKVDEVCLSPGQVFQAAKFNHLLQQGRLGWSWVL